MLPKPTQHNRFWMVVCVLLLSACMVTGCSRQHMETIAYSQIPQLNGHGEEKKAAPSSYAEYPVTSPTARITTRLRRHDGTLFAVSGTVTLTIHTKSGNSYQFQSPLQAELRGYTLVIGEIHSRDGERAEIAIDDIADIRVAWNSISPGRVVVGTAAFVGLALLAVVVYGFSQLGEEDPDQY